MLRVMKQIIITLWLLIIMNLNLIGSFFIKYNNRYFLNHNNNINNNNIKLFSTTAKKATGDKPKKKKSSSSSPKNNNNQDNQDDNQLPPTDPWKVLIQKLDSTKAPKIATGKVEKPSLAIVDELKCPHFGECSGCTIKGNFTESNIIRRATTFFQQENVPLKVHISNITQWRTNVKLAVQPTSRWGGLKIGLYKKQSHIVEAIPDCKVHHPLINLAVDELRQACLEAGVLGYQEANNGNPASGELRYLQMALERYTGKIQLVLVWNAPMIKYASQSLPRLIKKLKTKPEMWHSITVNFQTSELNTIFNYNPKAWKLMWGPPVLREKIGNATFFFRPQIFRQVGR